MPSVNDVALYILEKTGPITTMKLQKLVYYSQAWSLVWDEVPLYPEPIKAWVDGPVITALYACHKGKFTVSTKDILGNSNALTESQKDVINRVIDFYGNMTGQQLSQLSHEEAPWKEARVGLSPNELSNAVITHDRLAAYYASLTSNV